MRSDPERGLYCIDWNDEDPILIYGKEIDMNYSRLEIVFLPCNYLHNQYGYKEDTISPDCIADLEQQIKYIGASWFILYTNQERIMP